ncbi:V-SNARE [Ceraceosorus bombacis]|uniref:V-SNARE n=2 Tax=Ceraceosorus TaxID=401624 RepID=A0A0P1BQ43_9BASI|nr:putative BET1 protein [Ceraceosorus guamensis]PWN41601.1 putative BET1 protein [Ceraceosorus guamensis]CEH19021.1 V-SNARE [Ceraceosorus bombacis]
MYAKGANRTAEDLEEQNDQRLEGLSAKVRILKDITLGIGQEVRDGTAEMSTLSEAFSNTGSFLKGTFTRMNRMAGRQTGWFCNMMLFLMLVGWIFVIVWWWRR